MLAPGFGVTFEFLDYFELMVTQVSFHDFGIGFPQTAHSPRTSSTLTRELHPHSKYPWSHVTNGGEFDLELGFRGVRVLVKYFQYQIDSIPGLDLGFAFSENLVDMVYLRWFQDIPDDDTLGTELFSGDDHLLELPCSHIGIVVRGIALLDTLHDDCVAIGRYEILELRHTSFQILGFGVPRCDIDDYRFHMFLRFID